MNHNGRGLRPSVFILKVTQNGDCQDSLAWINGYTMEFLSSAPGSSGKKSYEQCLKIAKNVLLQSSRLNSIYMKLPHSNF